MTGFEHSGNIHIRDQFQEEIS